MKKQVISTIIIGALLISMGGCSSKAVDTKKAEVDKPVTVEEVKKPDAGAEDDKSEVQAADKNELKDTANDNAATAEPVAAPDKTADKATAKDQPKENQIAVQPHKSGAAAGTSEYFSNAPVTSVNTVQISPKHVYYKDSKLYMDAFVYNGFQHTIFDIRNINLRISNKSGVIAQAGFSGMGNAQIGPNNYIVWTFVFGPDTVVQQNADLTVLKTEFQCDNSY